MGYKCHNFLPYSTCIFNKTTHSLQVVHLLHFTVCVLLVALYNGGWLAWLGKVYNCCLPVCLLACSSFFTGVFEEVNFGSTVYANSSLHSLLHHAYT